MRLLIASQHFPYHHSFSIRKRALSATSSGHVQDMVYVHLSGGRVETVEKHAICVLREHSGGVSVQNGLRIVDCEYGTRNAHGQDCIKSLQAKELGGVFNCLG